MSEIPEREYADRLRLLVALEILRITQDFRARWEGLVAHWSRFRNRDLFLDLLYSRWRTLALTDLTRFDSAAILELERFYREVDALTRYLSVTEDMPTTLADAVAWHAERLERAGRAAFEALAAPLTWDSEPARWIPAVESVEPDEE